MILAPLFMTSLLAAPAPEGASGDVRAFVATITGEKGGAVSGLGRDDVAVLENGVAREIVAIEPDERPLTLALIVDTSEATRSALKLNVVEAATTFLRSLPEGSVFSIWSTGDRPTKVVDFTDDRAAAQKALSRLYPQGGNTLLDALAEVSTDLRKKEGARSAVAVITALGPELSNRDRWRSVREAEKKADLFLAVSFEEGPGTFEDRQSYDYVLRTLSDETGGRYETVLSPMGVLNAVGKLADDLKSQYRIKYLAAPDLKDKDRKLEVKVARPGVKVRLGASKASS
jgi:VWFA-related protein